MYIVNNQTKQARAKDDLWDKIFALIMSDLNNVRNKTVEIIYSGAENASGVGCFSKRITGSFDRGFFTNSRVQDFSESVMRDYSESYGEVLDFSK